MENKPRVFLFDAYALIYRAYYAFINRPMVNSKGVNTSAIYGFTVTLSDILAREKPEYAAVVFDPPSPTFRHEMYIEYKANRLSTPEEIKKSIPVIKAVIEAYNIPVIEIANFEADDVIGTLAKRAEANGMQVYMVTPDKDYMQLITSNINMLRPPRSGVEYEVIGIPEVRQFFGVDNPSQVVDILALWGDSSDNIPGAPGIGEKTARELIKSYQSLENLLKHVNELKPKQRDSLTTHCDQVLLSYKLATINTEVPVNIAWEDLLIKKKDQQKVLQLFKELEFKSLINKTLNEGSANPMQGNLFSQNGPVASPETSVANSIDTIQHRYHVVSSGAMLEELAVTLSGLSAFCFDTETTGLNAREAELVGISFSFAAHEAYYIPFPTDFDGAVQLLNPLRALFANPTIMKVGQNLKYDIQVLLKYNIQVEALLFDTMIAHYLLFPDLKHNLDYLAEIYLGYKMVPIHDLIGKKGAEQKSMREIELSIIKEYAGEDADITWQLYLILSVEIQKQGLSALSEKAEMPLVRVLAEMENAGFKISVENLGQYSAILRHDLTKLEAIIYSMAGIPFNINSPKQLGEILFETMHIAEGTQKTKTKQYSTGEEVLLKLADRHPIINHILDFRAMQKLLNTYVDALPLLIDKKTDKIHTSFDQAFVSTGRLSSRNPNLQNIPIRDDRGKEIRKAFIPSGETRILLSADYSQIELRLMAHLSRDENMVKAFLNDADIHISTAAKVFNVEEADVTPSMRTQAKTANFGIIYGISAFGLSQRLSISRTQASELISGYFNTFPLVKEYMDNVIVKAKESGYVETIMGRRRYLPDIYSSNAFVRGVAERNAINAPIQGSAADIIKLAMVNLQNRLRNAFKTSLILQVHDELILDVEKTELEEVQEMVKYEMEHVLTLQVPLIVKVGIGYNWFEAD